MALPDKEPRAQSSKESWRVDPHPFYQLLRKFLADEVKHNGETPNLDFWGEEPPKEIIFATGSLRKALIMSSVLNDIKVPFDHPMKLQKFFVNHVNNENGALQHKTFLGVHEGVPVYAESAAEGETEGNNPTQEARNKVTWLADKYSKEPNNYLFITTDVVDFVDWNDDGKINENEGLGKPINHPDFPQREGLSEVEYQDKVEEFAALFIPENFAVGKDLIHINGAALLEILAHSDDPREIKIWEVLIKTSITSDFMINMEINEEQGGGGASQQNQNWDSAEEIFSTLDDETQLVLKPFLNEDPEYFKMLVFFQIHGMPMMNFFREIELWAEQKRGQEGVVFDAKNK